MAESNSLLPTVKTRTITESEYRELTALAARAVRAPDGGEYGRTERDLIEAVLIGLDDLERALQAAWSGVSTDAVLDGVRLTSATLRRALERRGVTRITVAAGDRYDPAVHQLLDPTRAVAEPPRVSTERRAGYRLGGAVLRRAIVELTAEDA